MKLLFSVALLGALAVASATCPNLCSQQGTCGSNDRCTCFADRQGADCSERVCPYGLAWVDAPSATNEAHWYAECSNKGVCNRQTGECECFDGYEGKSCRRSSCPNDCSGHGTCYFLEQLKDLNGKHVVDYGNWKTGRDDVTWYDMWDRQKIQGCVCDPHYDGADCSLRQCPRGDNRLTTGSSTDGVTDAKDQGNTHQEILIATSTSTAGTNVLSGEFTLTFTDLYGGVWETDPIAVLAKDSTGTLWGGGTGPYVAARIKAELENLPNQVVESVTVTNIDCGEISTSSGYNDKTTAADCSAMGTDTICIDIGGAGTQKQVANGLAKGSYLGLTSALDDMWAPDILFQHGKSASTTGFTDAGTTAVSTAGTWGMAGQCLDFLVEFTGDQNAGVQELLEVNIAGCNYNGCAPHYSGLSRAGSDNDGTIGKSFYTAVQDVTVYVSSGSSNKLMHKESALCSEHGLCNTETGLCECFSGYYDEDCNKQTVLV